MNFLPQIQKRVFLLGSSQTFVNALKSIKRYGTVKTDVTEPFFINPIDIRPTVITVEEYMDNALYNLFVDTTRKVSKFDPKTLTTYISTPENATKTNLDNYAGIVRQLPPFIVNENFVADIRRFSLTKGAYKNTYPYHNLKEVILALIMTNGNMDIKSREYRDGKFFHVRMDARQPFGSFVKFRKACINPQQSVSYYRHNEKTNKYYEVRITKNGKRIIEITDGMAISTLKNVIRTTGRHNNIDERVVNNKGVFNAMVKKIPSLMFRDETYFDKMNEAYENKADFRWWELSPLNKEELDLILSINDDNFVYKDKNPDPIVYYDDNPAVFGQFFDVSNIYNGRAGVGDLEKVLDTNEKCYEFIKNLYTKNDISKSNPKEFKAWLNKCAKSIHSGLLLRKLEMWDEPKRNPYRVADYNLPNKNRNINLPINPIQPVKPVNTTKPFSNTERNKAPERNKAFERNKDQFEKQYQNNINGSDESVYYSFENSIKNKVIPTTVKDKMISFTNIIYNTPKIKETIINKAGVEFLTPRPDTSKYVYLTPTQKRQNIETDKKSAPTKNYVVNKVKTRETREKTPKKIGMRRINDITPKYNIRLANYSSTELRNICNQWENNKSVNPFTNRKISKSGPLYKYVNTICMVLQQ